MGNFIKQFFDIKFWKFILVGILNTVVGMGLQFLFFNLCGWNEWISSLVGYILGSILSYFLNKYFTFKNKDKGWKPIVKFALNIAVCYGLAYGIAIPLISMLCTANCWTMFGWSVEKFAGNFSMIVGACLFVAFNYIGQRFFAFREKKKRAASNNLQQTKGRKSFCALRPSFNLMPPNYDFLYFGGSVS